MGNAHLLWALTIRDHRPVVEFVKLPHGSINLNISSFTASWRSDIKWWLTMNVSFFDESRSWNLAKNTTVTLIVHLPGISVICTIITVVIPDLDNSHIDSTLNTYSIFTSAVTSHKDFFCRISSDSVRSDGYIPDFPKESEKNPDDYDGRFAKKLFSARAAGIFSPFSRV